MIRLEDEETFVLFSSKYMFAFSQQERSVMKQEKILILT